jgi:predicted CXXCH cytochrome family protein
MWSTPIIRRLALTSVAFLAASSAFGLTGCGDDKEPVGPESPPSAVTASAATNVDTVSISWTTELAATSYRIELAGGATPLTTTAGIDDQMVSWSSVDGIEDDVTYTATVFAINVGGETPSNTPTVKTNFFPWDEFFPTSLHVTGQGKPTFYGTVPNGGFEQYTGVAYDQLACKHCHQPEFTGGCSACHDTDTPTLGAEVDASLTGVCAACHGRQAAEAIKHGYSDVHRDAGMECMDCHTMEDLHGDGTPYASMLEDEAIDPKCTDCHETIGSTMYHNAATHGNVDCSACHVQSVISCYNCHFETQIELEQKVAYGQFKDWQFLVNRNGKVHTANIQALNYGDNTMVAIAPYYAHTIKRDAVTCSSCHGNEAVTDWHDDGVIEAVRWDPVASKLNYLQTRIPVPPNYNSGGLLFDFVDLDEPGGTVWSFLKSGADSVQLLYGTPLTQAQMDKLK